jgi:K+-transporting ATPase ATPase C chain
MLNKIIKQIKIGFMLLLLLTFLTGFCYPLMITGIAQLIFPWQANGSLIQDKELKIGSSLIGQSFDDPRFFWGRPSATVPFPYNGANSSGSNMGPSNPIFIDVVKARVKYINESHPHNPSLIPVDLVTASGSGLDPDISPMSAFYQVSRVAEANHLSERKVAELVNHLIKNRMAWVLGEPRVNVLELNMALAKMAPDSLNRLSH